MSASFRSLAPMLGAIALLASACQAQTPPAEAESFVDAMAALDPVIACIDRAPPQDRAAAEACVTAHGIALADLRQELGDPPRPVDILPIAAMFVREPGVQYTSEVQERALRYARCVEAAVLEAPESAGRSVSAFGAARAEIQAACMSLLPDVAELLRGGDVPQEVSVSYLLSNAMGGMIITHYAQARGWFPDELVPCVRYGDGRPPSPACAKRKMPPVVAPPPQTRPKPAQAEGDAAE